MKPLSKAEGLQLIRDVTNHAWKHLQFFDKKTIDKINGTAPIDVVATICHVVLFLSVVCDAAAIPFHTPRLYFIIMSSIVAISLILSLLLIHRHHDYNFDNVDTDLSDKIENRVWQYADDRACELGLKDDISKQFDDYPKNCGCCDADGYNNYDYRNEIGMLTFYAILMGKKKEAEDILNDYPMLPAMIKGLTKAYNYGQDYDKNAIKIGKAYHKTIVDIDRRLYDLVKPTLAPLIVKLIKKNYIAWVPERFRQNDVADFNRHLVHDLEESGIIDSEEE